MNILQPEFKYVATNLMIEFVLIEILWLTVIFDRIVSNINEKDRRKDKGQPQIIACSFNFHVLIINYEQLYVLTYFS